MNNQSAARAARKRAGRQIRIVLVDDSAPARTMLIRLLAPYLQVCIAGQAANGTEGLALAGSGYRGLGVPDCIRQGRERVGHLLSTTTPPATDPRTDR